MPLTLSKDIMDVISERQQRRFKTVGHAETLLPHEPEMLYIGCIDARLDPVKDIGIPQGKALIYRNVGALVPPPAKDVNAMPPEAASLGAALEFFVNLEPPRDDNDRP